MNIKFQTCTYLKLGTVAENLHLGKWNIVPCTSYN